MCISMRMCIVERAKCMGYVSVDSYHRKFPIFFVCKNMI